MYELYFNVKFDLLFYLVGFLLLFQMPREIHAKSTQNSRNLETQTAGGKIHFWSQDLIALSLWL